ncbi:NAD(P)-dependent oxidoreductase [Actinokineospora diospyrosa]|uniref:Phosphoglycerate dehydrogenase n=1 Tax=Actinokineospora diospyrosa TaxID=103728 RepID=A0ABT1I6C2_9PSEU|nr:NAD(P)-dependent oxidoreductase [Actinokineospora diospyrosa]MCP2268166.1 Phosphoglycerate dehydrogenase [Actinokineospora diospyrosa]
MLVAIAGVEVIRYDPGSSDLTPEQRTASVLIPPYRGSHRPIRLLPKLPLLQLVQLLTAGTDEWAPHVSAGIEVSNAGDAHAGPVSEWILSAILTQLRQWPSLVRFQDQQVWAHRKFSADTLAENRVLLVGAGNIGRATATKLAAFGAHTTLVGRSARQGVHGTSELTSLIPGHRVVVITTPLTEATLGLVDSKFLARMDDGALLVNASRGQVVETSALLAELQQGRLTAALDVTDPEPLPPEHPLWKASGVIISPHSARTVPGTNSLCYAVATSRVRQFLSKNLETG